jgi:hypothetical protein
VNLNKIERIFLILGITVVVSLLILLLVDDRILGFAIITGIFLLSLMIVDPLDSKFKIEKKKEKRKLIP